MSSTTTTDRELSCITYHPSLDHLLAAAGKHGFKASQEKKEHLMRYDTQKQLFKAYAAMPNGDQWDVLGLTTEPEHFIKEEYNEQRLVRTNGQADAKHGAVEDQTKDNPENEISQQNKNEIEVDPALQQAPEPAGDMIIHAFSIPSISISTQAQKEVEQTSPSTFCLRLKNKELGWRVFWDTLFKECHKRSNVSKLLKAVSTRPEVVVEAIFSTGHRLSDLLYQFDEMARTEAFRQFWDGDDEDDLDWTKVEKLNAEQDSEMSANVSKAEKIEITVESKVKREQSAPWKYSHSKWRPVVVRLPVEPEDSSGQEDSGRGWFVTTDPGAAFDASTLVPGSYHALLYGSDGETEAVQQYLQGLGWTDPRAAATRLQCDILPGAVYIGQFDDPEKALVELVQAEDSSQISLSTVRLAEDPRGDHFKAGNVYSRMTREARRSRFNVDAENIREMYGIPEWDTYFFNHEDDVDAESEVDEDTGQKQIPGSVESWKHKYMRINKGQKYGWWEGQAHEGFYQTNTHYMPGDALMKYQFVEDMVKWIESCGSLVYHGGDPSVGRRGTARLFARWMSRHSGIWTGEKERESLWKQFGGICFAAEFLSGEDRHMDAMFDKARGSYNIDDTRYSGWHEPQAVSRKVGEEPWKVGMPLDRLSVWSQGSEGFASKGYWSGLDNKDKSRRDLFTLLHGSDEVNQST